MPTTPSAASTSNTTELSTISGMHIDSPDGVIARPTATADTPNTESSEAFDPRREMMNAIVANRAKTFEQELAYGTDMAGEAIDDEAAEAADLAKSATVSDKANAEAIAVAQGQAIGNKQQTQESSAVSAHKKSIIVNGQTMEFTEDELVKLAQRGLSADQRFQEAAQMRQQYQQVLQQAQGQQNAQPTQQAAVQASPAVDEAFTREVSRRIAYGSEEEQAKAIGDLIEVAAKTAGRANQSLPPEQLANIAAQQALQVVRFEQNMETIGREYKDVFESEDLTILAARQVNKLRQKYEMLGTPKPDMEVYREAGNYVRSTYIKDSATQGQEGSSTNPTSTIQSANAAVDANKMASKVERKRVAPQPPAAASKIASEAPQQVFPTGSQVVAQMRKARHQQAF